MMIFYNYNPIIAVAILKYTNTERISTIVVINGAAIIAGSNFSFLASKGNKQPIDLDNITVTVILNPTVHASCKFLYCAKILSPLTSVNDNPTITAILTSFHKILNTSFT